MQTHTYARPYAATHKQSVLASLFLHTTHIDGYFLSFSLSADSFSDSLSLSQAKTHLSAHKWQFLIHGKSWRSTTEPKMRVKFGKRTEVCEWTAFCALCMYDLPYLIISVTNTCKPLKPHILFVFLLFLCSTTIRFSEAESLGFWHESTRLLLILFICIVVFVDEGLSLIVDRLDVLLLLLIILHSVWVVTTTGVHSPHACLFLCHHFLLELMLSLGHDRAHESTHSLDHHQDDTPNHSLPKSDSNAASYREHASSQETRNHSVLWIVLLPIPDEQTVNRRENTTPKAEVSTQVRRSISNMAQTRINSLSSWSIPSTYYKKWEEV